MWQAEWQKRYTRRHLLKIEAGEYHFNVAASRVKFDGFMTVYSYDTEKSTMNAAMKKITKDTEITLSELKPQQHLARGPTGTFTDGFFFSKDVQN